MYYSWKNLSTLTVWIVEHSLLSKLKFTLRILFYPSKASWIKSTTY